MGPYVSERPWGTVREDCTPRGDRALSRFPKDHPSVLHIDGTARRVDEEPAESGTWLFGGNPNGRGPLWMPVNCLPIESLQKFHHHLGAVLFGVRNALWYRLRARKVAPPWPPPRGGRFREPAVEDSSAK
jgi:hypothetical protein